MPKITENVPKLPLDVTMDLREEMEELIADALSNEYGFCVNGFHYEVDEDHNLHVYDIDWDVSED